MNVYDPLIGLTSRVRSIFIRCTRGAHDRKSVFLEFGFEIAPDAVPAKWMPTRVEATDHVLRLTLQAYSAFECRGHLGFQRMQLGTQERIFSRKVSLHLPRIPHVWVVFVFYGISVGRRL
jgi:hypothetical protein